jgi:hypothetical protein
VLRITFQNVDHEPSSNPPLALKVNYPITLSSVRLMLCPSRRIHPKVARPHSFFLFYFARSVYACFHLSLYPPIPKLLTRMIWTAMLMSAIVSYIRWWDVRIHSPAYATRQRTSSSGSIDRRMHASLLAALERKPLLIVPRSSFPPLRSGLRASRIRTAVFLCRYDHYSADIIHQGNCMLGRRSRAWRQNERKPFFLIWD